MTGDEAFTRIKKAASAVNPKAAEAITATSDLAGDGFFDSLDLMNFLFELESDLGHKIDQIDEDYTDFRVPALVNILETM